MGGDTTAASAFIPSAGAGEGAEGDVVTFAEPDDVGAAADWADGDRTIGTNECRMSRCVTVAVCTVTRRGEPVIRLALLSSRDVATDERGTACDADVCVPVLSAAVPAPPPLGA
jgi:hypothetical protein